MARKDVFGVTVEVGDIVFSAPRHKWSGKPEVGQVTGVFDSGRVTIKLPAKCSRYAYEEGAPDIERTSYRYVPDTEAKRDQWNRYPYKREAYTYMDKDRTVVGHYWKWEKKQAADITLVVIRKGGVDAKKDISEYLAESVGFNDLTRNLNLNYEADAPELD